MKEGLRTLSNLGREAVPIVRVWNEKDISRYLYDLTNGRNKLEFWEFPQRIELKGEWTRLLKDLLGVTKKKRVETWAPIAVKDRSVVTVSDIVSGRTRNKIDYEDAKPAGLVLARNGVTSMQGAIHTHHPEVHFSFHSDRPRETYLEWEERFPLFFSTIDLAGFLIHPELTLHMVADQEEVMLGFSSATTPSAEDQFKIDMEWKPLVVRKEGLGEVNRRFADTYDLALYKGRTNQPLERFA